jgi:hypothetical protein
MLPGSTHSLLALLIGVTVLAQVFAYQDLRHGSDGHLVVRSRSFGGYDYGGHARGGFEDRKKSQAACTGQCSTLKRCSSGRISCKIDPGTKQFIQDCVRDGFKIAHGCLRLAELLTT